MPIQLNSISQIIDDYDLFILDQWGVLHNGVDIIGDSLNALSLLKSRNKQVAILSNSGKPASDAIKRMAQIGIPKDLYDFMLTSGEHVYQCLQHKNEPFYENLGNKYYIFAWNEQEHEVIEDLPYERVQKIEDADFILCAGLDNLNLNHYHSRLKLALAHDLPMICVNSDKVTVTPSGHLVPCPGAIAEIYEQMGGNVRWHGKPDPWLYKVISQQFGSLDRAIAVGDSLHHDIQGANHAGIDSILITSGIHHQELSNSPSGESVAALATKNHAMPTHYMRDFG